MSAAAYVQRREELLIKYFKKKNATSVETALEPTQEMWKDLRGIANLNNLDKRSYIKKTPEGKYYLEEAVLEMKRKVGRISAAILFLITVLIFIAVVLSY